MKIPFSLRLLLLLGTASLTILADPPPAARPPAARPLRVLLVSGGCCNDYRSQRAILKQGLEARANLVIDQSFSDDATTKPRLPILGNPDYAKGYDLVIHDECAADISDPAIIEGVLKPHRDGIPGVNLHCAIHSYRIGPPIAPVTFGTPHALWFEYLGLQSSGHGPLIPIDISYTDRTTGIAVGLTNWTTIYEEQYYNTRRFDTALVIARGTQTIKRNDGSENINDFAIAWTNEYGLKKTRVFSLSLGRDDNTVTDPRYLDLVARGVLWATGHLDNDGSAAAGYGPPEKWPGRETFKDPL
jgi:hypothetical protein